MSLPGRGGSERQDERVWVVQPVEYFVLKGRVLVAPSTKSFRERQPTQCKCKCDANPTPTLKRFQCQIQ